MTEFEQKLDKMSLPSVDELKHEELIAANIINRKHKSSISFWWLSIPAYTIAAFFMKSFYYKGTSVFDMIKELINKEGYIGPVLFGVLPIVLLIINIISIRQANYLFGVLKRKAFIQSIFREILLIVLSFITLLIYGYEIFFS